MTARAEAPAPAQIFSADRVAVFAACAVIATINARAHHGFAMVVRDGFWAALGALFGSSAILWFALYALVAIGLTARVATAEPVRRGDRVVAGAMVAAAFMPLPSLAAGALLAGSAYLFWTSMAGSDARRLAIVMLAICGHVVLGRLALTLIGGPLLAVDAQVVAWLGGTTASGNVVQFVNGDSFVVSGTCSSLHNMSLGILCWATLTQLTRLRIDRRLILFLGITLAGLFMVNALRLVAIAHYPDQFDWLHQGFGASLFGIASLAVVLILSAWAVIDASRRQV